MILVGLVAAACSGPTPMDSTTTTTTTVPTSTTTTTTTTTTTAAVPEASPEVPAYFRFGDDGLYEGGADGTETQLVNEPIDWAASDHLGGVVFRYARSAQKPGTYRIAAGSAQPLFLTDWWGFTGLVDGRPVLAWVISVFTEDQDHNIGIGFLDLESGRTWTVEGDFGTGNTDLLQGPECVAGDLALGVPRWYGGGCSTNLSIDVWSISQGGPVAIDHNPQPESCDPCELSARLSPDGDLLAWWKVPTAHWPGPDCDFIERVDFWESVADVPASVSVVDLSDGTVLWSTEVGNQDRLVDFDGRWLVTGPWLPLDPERSLVYDTHGSTEPVAEIPGRIILNQNLEEDP